MNRRFKHITLFFVLVSVLCILSCSNKNSAAIELQQAKLLMETAPDSALTILNSIQSPENLSDQEYASYCLQLTQALDKNYILLTTDTLIKKAEI